jgi:hypothetical protein
MKVLVATNLVRRDGSNALSSFPARPPFDVECETVRSRNPIVAPLVTLAVAVIFVASTIVTDENVTPVPLAEMVSPVTKFVPRTVTLIELAPWASDPWLKPVTVASAGTT